VSKNAFFAADILLPKGDFETWSVIACDQFSAVPEYWKSVEEQVQEKSSTLHMIIPEAYLNNIEVQSAAQKRNVAMQEYLDGGVLNVLEDSFIYVERRMHDGKIRKGLVGKLDLDAYDYSEKSQSAVRASEKTIVERLPIRVEVRKNAPIETPHVMVLIDDIKNTVIEPISAVTDKLEKVYDFELMKDGGHIAGWKVSGEIKQQVMSALDVLADAPVQMVVGDGNHSLAAAKASWELLKKTLSEDEVKQHPAKFARVELNNIYDEGVGFEPIHRIIFGVDIPGFIAELKNRFTEKTGYTLRCEYAGGSCEVKIPAESAGELIAIVQSFLDEYVGKTGCEMDFIHDDDAVSELAGRENVVGIFMPAMDKTQLFGSVITSGVFPRKSFSIGQASEKRYYLECRKIK